MVVVPVRQATYIGWQDGTITLCRSQQHPPFRNDLVQRRRITVTSSLKELATGQLGNRMVGGGGGVGGELLLRPSSTPFCIRLLNRYLKIDITKKEVGRKEDYIIDLQPGTVAIEGYLLFERVVCL
jgi:hypothetical protein